MKILNLVLSAVFAVSFSTNIFSQEVNVDSLLSVLDSSTDTKEKVNILNTLALNQIGKNDSLILLYANDAISQAEKIDYNLGLGNGYRNIGHISFYKGELKEARGIYLKAKKYFEKADNKKRLSAIINDIGMTHSYSGENEEALENFQKSALIDKELKDTAGLTAAYTNISAVLNRQEKNIESIEYAKKAMRLDSLTKEWGYYVQDLGNIATHYKKIGQYDDALNYALRGFNFSNEIDNHLGIYLNAQVIGDVYRFLGDYNSSEIYLQKSLLSAKEFGRTDMIGNAFEVLAATYHKMDLPYKALSNHDSALLYISPINKSIVLGNIGELYVEKINNLDSALYFHQESIQAASEISDSLRMILPLLQLGFVQNKKGNTKEAIVNISKALEIKKSLGNPNIIEESKLLKGIAEVFRSNNDYNTAYSFLSDAVTFQDSLIEIEQSAQKKLLNYEKDIRQLHIKEQALEIKEKEIGLQKRLYFMLGLGALALLAITFGFILRNKNKKLAFANENLRNLSNETHHRVKNDFQSISSMIFVQQNEIQNPQVKQTLLGVRDRILAMGQIHMLFYKEGNYFKMGLAKYLHSLVDKRTKALASQYVKAHVDVNIDIDNNIEQRVSFDEAKQLGIVINELITNVFKHAFKDNQSPALAFKAYVDNQKKLIIEVIDNGVGIETDSSGNENSFGLKMINMTCKQLGWELKTQSAGQKKGTIFTIIINTKK